MKPRLLKGLGSCHLPAGGKTPPDPPLHTSLAGWNTSLQVFFFLFTTHPFSVASPSKHNHMKPRPLRGIGSCHLSAEGETPSDPPEYLFARLFFFFLLPSPFREQHPYTIHTYTTIHHHHNETAAAKRIRSPPCRGRNPPGPPPAYLFAGREHLSAGFFFFSFLSPPPREDWI